MNIQTTRKFDKKSARLPRPIQSAVLERLTLFLENPHHSLLYNHPLSGKRKNQRSINITGDYRLIFEQVDEHTARLLDVDTHHNLYGS